MRVLQQCTRFILVLLALAALSGAALAQGLPIPPPVPIIFPPDLANDQKPGSVLFFNRYMSNAVSSVTADTQINITNTNQSVGTYVHLFFVNGATCAVANGFRFLQPSQPSQLSARAEFPGPQGYIMVVAVDPSGLPQQFNYLIGDAYVRENTGVRQADLAAVSFVKMNNLIPALLPGGGSTTLVFDDGFSASSYERLPRELALDSFNSQATNNTNLVIYSPSNDLLALGAATNNVSATLYKDDDPLTPIISSFSTGCYRHGTLGTVIPTSLTVLAGHTAWIRLRGTSAIPLLGAVIHSGPPATSFNGGHNLHHLTLLPSYPIRIPVV